MVNIQDLLDDARCYETVRSLRWPDGVVCPHCSSASVIKNGRDDTQPDRQRYECRGCARRFDDLTGTIFADHHQPLKTWIACLYLMGLNLSGLQIAKELDINKDDARAMIQQLRQGSSTAGLRSPFPTRSNATKSMSSPRGRGIRARRRRGRLLRGPRQRHGRVPVADAVVAPPSPWNPAGDPSAVPRFLRVRPLRPSMWQETVGLLAWPPPNTTLQSILSHKQKLHGLDGSVWEASGFTAALNHVFRTQHDRPSLARSVDVYHTLLLFCAN